MDFDTEISTRALRRRLAIEEDPAVRRLLGLLIQHMEAELSGDLEAVMATLIPEPVFHIYNMREADGRIINRVVSGGEAVRAMYTQTIGSGIMALQEYDVSLYVIDRYGAAHQGRMRMPLDGAALAAMGYDADPAAFYLYEGSVSTFWPVENGLFRGEDIYFDPTAFDTILEKPIMLPKVLSR